MAQITGSSVALKDTVVSSDSILLDGAVRTTTATLNGTTFLYVTSRDSDAVQIFSVSSDGSLTALANLTDTAGTTLNGATDAAHVRPGGNDFLVVSGSTDDGVTSFALSDTPGYASFADAVFDSENAAYEMDAAYSLASFETGSASYVYVAGQNDAGISVFEVTDTGAFVSVDTVADNATLNLNGVLLSEVFTINSSSYLLASGEFEDGISLFRINSSNGTLTSVANFSDAGVLENPAYGAGVGIDGVGYLYVPSFFGDSITVFRFTPGGDIEQVQQIKSPGQLNGAGDIRVVESGDTLILVVGAFDSDIAHFYEIDSNGASGTAGELTLIQSVTDGALGAELNRTHIGQGFEIDGTTFVPVLAQNGNTVNIFEIGGGDDVLEGTQDDDVITGGGGDDVIYGLGGNDEIDGGNDDDVIYAGSGVDTVFASNGFDRSFGGSNFDTFDAGFFDGSSNGVQIDTAFDLFRTPGGFKQFISGFERLHGTDQDDDLRGDDANNDLRGFDGDDVLNGRGGNDSLRGQNGDDRLLGVNGDDFLFGGAGNDDLRGGAGNDVIDGGSDDDFILGEGGADTINGGRGNDSMRGNSGADVFVFDNYALSATEFDIVRDFTDGVDLLDLTDFGFANAGAALSGASQRSWGVRLELDADQVVSLEGVSLSDLSAADLIL